MIDGTEVSCVPPLALFFRDFFPKLRLCRTHFHYNKEYLNMSLMAILKNHCRYCFEHFVSMPKLYLGPREKGGGEEGAVELELDIYEYFIN